MWLAHLPRIFTFLFIFHFSVKQDVGERVVSATLSV